LEGVWSVTRNEYKRPRWRAHNTFAELDIELTAHNVTKLGFHSMLMRRRTALRRDGLTKNAEYAAGLLSRRQQLGNVSFPALLAAVALRFAGQDDKRLSLSGGDCGRPGGQHKENHSGSN
jgi:hypothetical protein